MDIRTPVATIYGDLPTQFAELWMGQLTRLKERFGGAVDEVWMPGTHRTDIPVVFISAEEILSVLRYLKAESGFEYQFLSDITATDEQPDPLRFHVVYQLFSHATKARLRVKVRVREDQEVPSAISVWAGANWAEREVFDMFGIRFSGHPDLRRILMDPRWEGYPLRKDYPLRGYQFFPNPEPVDPELLR